MFFWLYGSDRSLKYLYKYISHEIERQIPDVRASIANNSTISWRRGSYYIDVNIKRIDTQSPSMHMEIDNMRLHIPITYFLFKKINRIELQGVSISIHHHKGHLSHDKSMFLYRAISMIDHLQSTIETKNVLLRFERTKIRIPDATVSNNLDGCEIMLHDGHTSRIFIKHKSLKAFHIIGRIKDVNSLFLDRLDRFISEHRSNINADLSLDMHLYRSTSKPNIYGQVRIINAIGTMNIFKQHEFKIDDGSIGFLINDLNVSLHDIYVKSGNTVLRSIPEEDASHQSNVLFLKAFNIHRNEVLGFWKGSFHADARSWFHHNIQSGIVREAEIMLSDKSLSKLDIANVKFSVSDLMIADNENYPGGTNVSGDCITDTKYLTCHVVNGKFKRSKVKNLDLNINNDKRRRFKLKLQGHVDGFFHDFIKYIPGNVSKHLENADGRMHGDVRFDVLDGIVEKYGISLNIREGYFMNDIIRISNIDGNIKMNDAILDVGLRGSANNQEFSLMGHRDHYAHGVIGKYKVYGMLSSDDIMRAGMTDAVELSGNAYIYSRIKEFANHFSIKSNINLDNMDVHIPELGWNDKDHHMKMSVDSEFKKNQQYMESQFAISASNMSVIGLIKRQGGEYSAILKRAHLGKNDFSMQYKRSSKSTNFNLNAQYLTLGDLSSWLKNKMSDQHDSRIRVTSKIIAMHNKVKLRDSEVNFNCESKKCWGDVYGAFDNSKGRVVGGYGKSLDISTNNAGMMISGLGISDLINKGDMFLSLDTKSSLGSIRMRNFSVKNLSLLMQILSMASLENIDIGKNGSEKGVKFDHLDSRFRYKNNKIILQRSIMENYSLGISFAGVINNDSQKMSITGGVMPFYWINKILWSIPIVNSLLVDKRSPLVEVEYKISGKTHGNKTTQINVLSVFSPGILKYIREMLGLSYRHQF